MSRAVIDQSGFRVVIIGLALSVFLGLALRAQISESRIQSFLNRSVDRLQADFFVDYDDARVNLSSWGMPIPTLVIKNIRLSPKATLCQSSQIYIDELEVPISFSMLLGLNLKIPKIRAKEVELRLSDIDKCISRKNAKNEVDIISSETNAKTQKEVNTESQATTDPSFKNIFSNKTKAELNEVSIEKLKIISSKNPNQPFLFKQMSVELVYNINRLSEVHIKSKLNALKDSRSDVFLLNANFESIFKTKENKEVESIASFNGKLLDGDIQLFTHNFIDSKKISYELALEQVSVKALFPFFENTDLDKNINFEKTPISVSFVNSGDIYLTEKTSLDSKFKKVQINFENGLLKTNEIELNYSDSKFSFKPFEISINALSLSKLKNIEGIKEKLDSFDSLGYLTGSFDFKNENSYVIKGNVKNIQAVFSNRGRRDLQAIDSVDVSVERNLNNLQVVASKFFIAGEMIDAKFEALQDLNSNTSSAVLKINNASLNNKIWEQFTFVEQSPKFSVLWNYKKSIFETHNVNLYVDKLGLPGVKLENLNIEINQVLDVNAEKSSLYVMIKPSRLVADQSFLDNKTFKKIFNIENGFTQDSFSSNKSSLQITGTDWKNINFNIDTYFLSEATAKPDSHLNFKGSVKYEIGLEGKVLLQNKTGLFKFDVVGSPDEEIVIK
jgi:hypothetical protein